MCIKMTKDKNNGLKHSSPSGSLYNDKGLNKIKSEND